MKRDDIISDEQLNAFTDGELEPDEEDRIFTLSEQCSELDGRLCQQRKLKELVQHAYRTVPGKRRSEWRIRPRKDLLSLTAAAIVTLAVGIAAGWFAARSMDDPRAGLTVAQSATAAHDSWLLHVSSDEPEMMEAALTRAERLMSAPDATPGRRVEIVANESGLNLLRSDTSPFADRIRELAANDVMFFACTRAIERLREQGIEVKLLPEADTRYSALDRVALRLQEGWSYQRL